MAAELQLTNLSTGQVSTASVIDQRLAHQGELSEYGVEILGQAAEFWGIIFEAQPPQPSSYVAGLFICRNCSRRYFTYLSREEYLRLSQDFVFRRPCLNCQACTEWEVCSADEKPSNSEAVDRGEMDARQTGAEVDDTGVDKRGAVRYVVKVPLHVVGPTGTGEDTVTEDLSKTGMMFTCGQRLEIGGRVRAIVGYGVATSRAMTCRVVRRIPEEASNRYRYGVLIESVGPREGPPRSGIRLLSSLGPPYTTESQSSPSRSHSRGRDSGDSGEGFIDLLAWPARQVRYGSIGRAD